MRTAVTRLLLRAMLIGVVPVNVAVCPAVAAEAAAAADAPAGRPNFVFILIDDLRWDAMSCAGHPFVRTPNIDRIAAGGLRFTNAFVTTSLCSPSRASFLTGTYAHTHGVRTNEKNDPDPALPTFPQALQAAGYETAFIGKWHMRVDADPRPGFDYWLSFKGQGEYNDPELNENGRQFQAKGYMTDLLTQYAVDFLKRPREKPFCLYLSHKAVHADFTPAERHQDLYGDLDLPAPPSYRDTLAGKPRWQREIRIRGGRLQRPLPGGQLPDKVEPPTWDSRTDQNQRIVNWYRTLAAVDDSVGRVLDALEAGGAAARTVVMFAGDNGFFHGEHGGMGDKRLAYEESIRIPLMVSGPGVAVKAGTAGEMVLNVDVAPTILDLAGVKAPVTIQGRSVKPLLAGQRVPWRQSFLYEYFREGWLPGIPTMVGVRAPEWKYVRYPDIDDIEELYDLKSDPLEMHNLAAEPAARAHLDRMRRELEGLQKKTRAGGQASSGSVNRRPNARS